MKLRECALLSLMISGSTFANSCPFEGFYGSLDIGYAQTTLKDDYETLIQVPGVLNLTLTAIPTKVTKPAFTAGLALGYGASFCNLYLIALEGRANFQDQKTIVDHQHIEVNSALLTETKTSVKLDNDFALLAKLGLIPDPNILLYGLVGADWGDIDIVSNATYTQNIGTQLDGAVQDSHSYYETAWVLGLGIEYLFMTCASIGLEYNYIDYGNLDFPGAISGLISLNGVPTEGTLFSDNNTLKLKDNRVTLRFNYYFA